MLIEGLREGCNRYNKLCVYQEQVKLNVNTFFVIKVNSKMCAFSALYVGIGSNQTVQYLHRKKNEEFDQSVWCK